MLGLDFHSIDASTSQLDQFLSVRLLVPVGVEVAKLINVNQMATKTVEGFVSFGSFASGQRVNVLFVIGIDRPARTAGKQVALKAGVG